MKIALISCAKSKKSYRCMAKELYSPSNLFSTSYKYAKALNVDKIYILSAKYGLIHEDTLVDPYELSMKDLPTHRQRDWANYVKQQLERELNPYSGDEYIILSGEDYLQPLLDVKAFEKYSFPLFRLTFGKRMSFMNNEIEKLQSSSENIQNNCLLMHELFNKQKIYNYSEIDFIPFNNGIYIVFEKGETFNLYNRIVRVGTHTSPNRLKTRLKDHYISKNKDGSIFRKNIGKAILNQRNDTYLSNWHVDTSKPENKHYVNHSVQAGVEDEVSKYLQENTFFTVFEVGDPNERIRLESGIIASLNSSKDFQKSRLWLGNHSTEHEITNSGMWLKKGLKEPPLTEQEILKLQKLLDSDTYCEEFVHITSLPQKHNDAPDFHKISVNDVAIFIKQILVEEQEKGSSEITLISGDIAKQMGVKQRMPTICSGMKKDLGYSYEILYAPPSGKGTRLKIKYFL